MSGYRRSMAGVLTYLVVMTGGGAVMASPAAALPLVPTPAPQSITTIAGNGSTGSGGDGGVAIKAQLNVPSGVAEDLTGSLYIADTGNNKIRKVVAPTLLNNDNIVTFAGTGTRGFAGDGGPATLAMLSSPAGVAVDTHGDVFIADSGNGRVREVSANGIIKTIAGNGASCRNSDRDGDEDADFSEVAPAGNADSAHVSPLGNGGPATSATLCTPTGVAVDTLGNVYVSDTGHSQVREISALGIITDFAGTGQASFDHDGKAAKARLNSPTGLAVDSANDVFIADTGNNAIREVTPTGIITTFAGKGQPGFSGDGGLATKARLLFPTGVVVDQLGNVYIADTGNQRLRKVDVAGTISTFAGRGRPGFSGDGGPATEARLFLPTGSLAVDGTAVYFSDTGNQRIRGVFGGPLPILPEVPYAVLLPLSGVLIVGIGLWMMRRRRHVVA